MSASGLRGAADPISPMTLTVLSPACFLFLSLCLRLSGDRLSAQIVFAKKFSPSMVSQAFSTRPKRYASHA